MSKHQKCELVEKRREKERKEKRKRKKKRGFFYEIKETLVSLGTCFLFCF